MYLLSRLLPVACTYEVVDNVSKFRFPSLYWLQIWKNVYRDSWWGQWAPHRPPSSMLKWQCGFQSLIKKSNCWYPILLEITPIRPYSVITIGEHVSIVLYWEWFLIQKLMKVLLYRNKQRNKIVKPYRLYNPGARRHLFTEFGWGASLTTRSLEIWRIEFRTFLKELLFTVLGKNDEKSTSIQPSKTERDALVRTGAVGMLKEIYLLFRW